MKIKRLLLILSLLFLILDLTGCVERFTVSPPQPTSPQPTPSSSLPPQTPATPPPPAGLRIRVAMEDLVDYPMLTETSNILRDALGIDISFVSPQEEADLYVAPPDEIAKLAQQGSLQPLQDIIGEVSPPLASLFGVGGNLYAIPLGGKAKVLLVNTSLLLSHGLPPRPPATFEEWAKMMRILKSKGFQHPLILPLKGDGVLENLELLSAVYGGTSYSQGKPNLTDATRRSLIALSALMKEGLIDPLSYEAGDEEAKEALKGGRNVFTVVWGEDLPSDLQVALVPPSQEIYDLEKKPAISLGKVRGIAMSSSTSMLKEAKAFLKLLWYLQKKNSNTLETLALSFSNPCPPFLSYPQENELLKRYVLSTLQGVLPPEEAVSKAQEALRSLPPSQPPSTPTPSPTQTPSIMAPTPSPATPPSSPTHSPASPTYPPSSTSPPLTPKSF